jgi:hypothetical protein
MRTVTMVLVGILLLLEPAAVFAEEPAAPQPTAEHEALEMWVGSWSGEGELKPGPFGPGGPMKWTENCSWFENGNFHVICRSEGTSPMGEMKGLGIVGYNPAKQVYTHYGVDSTGWSGYSEGTKSGDTWTFRSQEMIGGTTYHTKMVMTMSSPDTTTFTWEMSEDGSSWTVLMSGTNTKE